MAKTKTTRTRAAAAVTEEAPAAIVALVFQRPDVSATLQLESESFTVSASHGAAVIRSASGLVVATRAEGVKPWTLEHARGEWVLVDLGL